MPDEQESSIVKVSKTDEQRVISALETAIAELREASGLLKNTKEAKYIGRIVVRVLNVAGHLHQKWEPGGQAEPTEEAARLHDVPFELLAKVYKERYKKLRAEQGPHFTNKKVRPCKGCGEPFSAREMRAHKCPSGLSWRKR
jgi:hypothetical protein